MHQKGVWLDNREVKTALAVRRLECELLGAQIGLVCKPRMVHITTIFPENFGEFVDFGANRPLSDEETSTCVYT